MRAGRDFWRTVPADKRTQMLHDVGSAIARANDPGLILFGAVIEKSDTLYGEEAVKRATADCCRRFDLLLGRMHFEQNDTQRGLVIFAEGRYDQRAKLWVKDFRRLGTEWGVVRNLADIPFFANAKETRLLQIADYVAHALFLLYERRDPSLIRAIIHRFDRKAGVLHGIGHVTRNHADCECPGCASRRSPGELGMWLQEPLL